MQLLWLTSDVGILVSISDSLEKVVGVDISQRCLARAAKILHTKLTTQTEAGSSQIKSAVLYDGSITTFDSQLLILGCMDLISEPV